ncbi:hypothetical protein JCM10207_006703 [Rhodosporidiobolus poonsookiae]
MQREDEALLTPSEDDGEPHKHFQGTDRETKRLLWGFMAYSVASEVFAVVVGGLFLPISLEQYARSNGRAAPEHEVACPLSGGAAESDGAEAARCDVRLFGAWVDTASFSLFVYSASVALQALTVISMGSLADDPHVRHRLLVIFAMTGSLLCIAFLLLPETSALWPVAALLAIGANVTFGASLVCLNSYLPDLGRRAPSVQRARSALLAVRRQPLSPSSSADLLEAQSAYTAARGAATSRISSRAIAAGYAAGIGALVALIPVVTALSGGEGPGAATWPLRVAIAASGMWWLVGTLPSAIWLRPPFSVQALATGPLSVSEALKPHSLWDSIKQGWRGLGKMLGEWRSLPQTFIFLAAWFVLSDAFATVTSTAMLFAKTALNMPTSSLIIVAILAPLSGIFGAIAFPTLQKRGLSFRLPSALSRFLPPSLSERLPTSADLPSLPASSSPTTNHHMLILLVLLATVIPLWGLVSLRTSAELYCLAVVFGALWGSFQAYARTCFAELIPASQSARWYSLYSITDKSSSFLGPMLVAAVTNATGEIRHGFFIILALLLVAVPILVRVNMEQGSADAEEYDQLAKEGAGERRAAEEEPLVGAGEGV